MGENGEAGWEGLGGSSTRTIHTHDDSTRMCPEAIGFDSKEGKILTEEMA